MSGISFAQQNHLALLISERIGAQVDAIQAQHADELRAITNAAMQAELERRGLQPSLDQLAELKEQAKSLSSQLEKTRDTSRQLRDQLKAELGFNFYHSVQGEADDGWFDAFNRELHRAVQPTIVDQTRATDWGQRMLRLQTEQSQLTDTIYLTTGSREFAAVLARFNNLLEIGSTPLQAALSEPEPKQLPAGLIPEA